jgi:hypothetical protein
MRSDFVELIHIKSSMNRLLSVRCELRGRIKGISDINKEVNIDLPYDLAILLLGLYPRNVTGVIP